MGQILNPNRAPINPNNRSHPPGGRIPLILLDTNSLEIPSDTEIIIPVCTHTTSIFASLVKVLHK